MLIEQTFPNGSIRQEDFFSLFCINPLFSVPETDSKLHEAEIDAKAFGFMSDIYAPILSSALKSITETYIL